MVKAALLKGPGEVTLEDVPVPKISDSEVLVEVKCCGICGSDVHAIPDAILYRPSTYMGHEFSGILAEVGKNVKGWKVGDRVVVNPMFMCGECYACLHGHQSQCSQALVYFIGCAAGRECAGAFAKFVRVSIPQFRLFQLPDELSFEEGALVEPLAVSLHAVRMSSLKPREHAMVLGAGPIGLGVIAHLRNAGAGLIINTETNQKRAEVAKKFGADFVFNPQKDSNLPEKILELTKGKGVDLVFDCSGIAEAFRSSTAFVRKGGEIILVGQITREVPVLPVDFTLNELRLQGVFCYYVDEFPMVIDFLRSSVSPVQEMITSKIKLSDIGEQGFNKLLEPGHTEIKILVSPE